jgi:hypothetical protein
MPPNPPPKVGQALKVEKEQVNLFSFAQNTKHETPNTKRIKP